MPTAKKKNKTRQINLVPEEGLSSTTSGRVLLWILSTFRIILIITELVVIGAFISRFWLDAKNTDLSEEMKEAKSVISSLSEFEKDFKSVQQRLTVFDAYKENKGKLDSNIKTIVAYKPQGINIETINVSLDKITISAESINEFEIQQYLVNLKSSGKFDNVSLSNISLLQDYQSFKFSINATVKQEL